MKKEKKEKKGKKKFSLIRFLTRTLVVLICLLALLLLSLPLLVPPVVKKAAALGGQALLGVPVSIGSVGLNPFTGGLSISQLKIPNPEGFSNHDAFSVDRVAVDLKLSSLFSDTVVIENVEVRSPVIRYETVNRKANFDALTAGLKSGEKKEEGKKPAGDEAGKPAGKKVVIDRFSLSGAKVVLANKLTLGKGLTLPLPPVTLTGIGRKSGGATASEAAGEIASSVMSGIASLSGGALETGRAALSGARDAAEKAAGEARKAAAGAQATAEKAAGEARKAVSDARDEAKKAVKGMSGALKEAGETGKGLMDLFKKKKKQSTHD